MRSLKLVPFLFTLLTSLLGCLNSGLAGVDDSYRRWARANFSQGTTADLAREATAWGETADPDHDGIPNLLEYAADTDPNARTSLSDVYTFSIPPGQGASAHPQILAWQRTDDPDLRIVCQVATEPGSWWPALPHNSSQPATENFHIFQGETGSRLRGLRQVAYVDRRPMANRAASYMRLVALRRQVVVTGPALEPFTFTDVTSAQPGSTVRSSTVIMSGFAGSFTFTIPPGVTLYINGVAQYGTTAIVQAGDHLWMVAKAPDVSGASFGYNLAIGGHSATWTVSSAALGTISDHAGLESGYTPVEAGVSESGAAQISIPIVVSSGPGGIQPTLSINYSSQGGNGPLGLGFSLSGLNTISRTGATFVHDGFKGGITFGDNDRYVFDGQRLISTEGRSGTDGAEYRLEFDPSTRIRSYGVAGNGPSRWQVETKAGLKLDFGLAANSRVYPENGHSPLVWAVEKISDTVGNSLTVSYDETARQHGELLVTRIAYASNQAAGLSANQDVIFEYEDRTDTRTSYVGGFAVKMLKRMKAIESRALDGGTMKRVRRYEAVYQGTAPAPPPVVPAPSRLSAIYELAAGAAPRPTLFSWENTSSPLSFNSNDTPFDLEGTGFSKHAGKSRLLPADYDGDGICDILMLEYGGDHTCFLGKGSYFVRVKDIGPAEGMSFRENEKSRFEAGDYNGDGLTDVIHFSSGGEQTLLKSLGGGKFSRTIVPELSTSFSESYKTRFLTGDFNGDGRSDTIRTYVNESGNPSNYVALSQGNDTFSRVENAKGLIQLTYSTDSGKSQFFVHDVNGDGRSDILVLNYGGSHRLCLSNGDGTFEFRATVPGLEGYTFREISKSHLLAGDYNGDGLVDILHGHYDGSYWLALSKGDGSFVMVEDVKGLENRRFPENEEGQLRVGDFNADGLSDVLYGHYLGDYWIAYSKGDGSFSPQEVVVGLEGQQFSDDPGESRVLPGDFNGDGVEDVAILRNPGNHYIAYSDGIPGRVTGVENGHGGSTKFTYRPTTDPTVYIKGSGLIYPSLDIQPAMVVVAAISTRNGTDVDAFTGDNLNVSGENVVTYLYEGAWTDLNGRGFQGFQKIQTMDQTTGLVSATVSGASSPLLAGRPIASGTWTAAGALVKYAINQWKVQPTVHPSGWKTHFIYPEYSWEYDYEINGQLPNPAKLRTKTTFGLTHDAHGNVLHMIVDQGDLREEITNTYLDVVSPTRWHLGRLSRVDATKSMPRPGGGFETFSSAATFAYHPVTGLLTQEVTEPDGGALRLQKDYTHDNKGNIATSTLSTAGEASRTTSTSYTADGRFVASTTNAKGHTEIKKYDPLLGNVVEQTGPNGLTTRWSYDALGRPVREQRPDGTETRSFYHRAAGAPGAPPRAVHYVRVQSTGGAAKTVWYDLLDREIRADSLGFDGETVSAHKVYNARGEVTHASQPYRSGEVPLYTTMQYDSVGREVLQADPGNRLTRTVHNGLRTSVINPLNQTVSTTTNVMGWTVQTTDAAGKSINRSYDPRGQLRFVTDPAGNTTELRYDRRGNKVWMSEPNSGISTFTYNGFGDLTTQTNSAGQVVSLGYDSLGRVVGRRDPEGVTNFEFDTAAGGIGQLARESAPGFTRLFYYDHLSRPTATVESHGFHSFAVSRGYDALGRPGSLTFPTGLAVRQDYTTHGHLSQVANAQDPARVYWRAELVNARGQVTRERLGNNLLTTRGFDPQTGLISALSTSGGVQSLAFGFDSIGNLTERSDTRFNSPFIETFGYDTLNRLKQVETTGAISVSATYDDLGNLRTRSDVGVFSYAQNGAGPHAVTTVHKPDGALNKACAYNVKGERTVDGATTLDYSSFGKPVRIRKGGEILGFDYGPDRALYRQTFFQTDANNVERQTVREYVGGLYERETTSEGTVRHTHYIAGGSGVVAIVTDEHSAANAAQRTRYIHKDHLGSVDAITDSAGAVVERQSFDAWGRRRTLTFDSGNWLVTYPGAPAPGKTSSETHRGFTGHEMLDAVGLVHMGGRVYDPLTARFLSPDPFVQSPDNLQNLNRYSYVLNNPLSFTDPSGFFHVGRFLKKNWKTVVAVGVGVLTGGLAAWAVVPAAISGGTLGGALGAVASGAAGWIGAAAAGAGYGFGSSFSGTLLAGGSVGDSLRAGFKSGIQGGAQAAATFGVADALGLHNLKAAYTQEFAGKLAVKIAAHGVIGGGFNELQGGAFRHGFFAGAAAGGASPFIAAAELSGIGQVAAAAVVGGTASSLGGGKFANGAVTGAFSYLFNEGVQSVGQPGTAESFIPFWGSGRALLDDLQNGNYWGAVTDAGFLVLDGFTLGAGGLVVKGAAKGLGLAGKAVTKLTIKEAEVTFGHGSRHLIGSGLSSEAVEGAIRQDVSAITRMSDGSTGAFWGKVTVNGSPITYRAHTLSNGAVHVGTYTLPR